MIITKRIATAAAVTAISLGSVVAPAMASSKAKPKHLTSSQCASAKTAWVKKHPHATSKQKAVYNKVLKAEGCTVTV